MKRVAYTLPPRFEACRPWLVGRVQRPEHKLDLYGFCVRFKDNEIGIVQDVMALVQWIQAREDFDAAVAAVWGEEQP